MCNVVPTTAANFPSFFSFSSLFLYSFSCVLVNSLNVRVSVWVLPCFVTWMSNNMHCDWNWCRVTVKYWPSGGIMHQLSWNVDFLWQLLVSLTLPSMLLAITYVCISVRCWPLFDIRSAIFPWRWFLFHCGLLLFLFFSFLFYLLLSFASNSAAGFRFIRCC